MKFIFIYITASNKKEAEKIARHLLEKRLIACANFFPIESLYWWRNKIKKSREFALVGKTKEKDYKKILKEVEQIHSYSVPCVAKTTASFNQKYGKWLMGEISKKS